ncbi:MAG: cell division protein FtsQ/DivIB [Candidatus Dojkabacteria bacterium]
MHKVDLRKSVFINKVSRTSVGIFLKRYSLPFLILLFFILSNIFGLWNVRNIQFSTKEGSNVNLENLSKRVEKFKGKNIFLLSSKLVEEDISKEKGYVKKIYVEKKIPFTLEIKVDEYIPLYMGYSAERCILFSSEGTRIEQVCTECLDTCRSEGYISIQSNAFLESNNRLIFVEEIKDIEKLLSTFGYSVSSITLDEGVSRFTSEDGKIFTFDISFDLDLQLSRMYLVGQKINDENIEFASLDLRFERPVMRLK